MSKCEHCWSNPDSPNVWPPKESEIQLWGVNLCMDCYKIAVVIRGRVLTPQIAKEMQLLLPDFEYIQRG